MTHVFQPWSDGDDGKHEKLLLMSLTAPRPRAIGSGASEAAGEEPAPVGDLVPAS